MYAFVIDYNYPVTAFSGKKSIILSTDDWVGGKNVFLGTCYIVVASISLVVVLVFLALSKPRSDVEPKW